MVFEIMTLIKFKINKYKEIFTIEIKIKTVLQTQSRDRIKSETNFNSI